MPKLIVEHDEVGAWMMLNNTFVDDKPRTLNPHTKEDVCKGFFLQLGHYEHEEPQTEYEFKAIEIAGSKTKTFPRQGGLWVNILPKGLWDPPPAGVVGMNLKHALYLFPTYEFSREEFRVFARLFKGSTLEEGRARSTGGDLEELERAWTMLDRRKRERFATFFRDKTLHRFLALEDGSGKPNGAIVTCWRGEHPYSLQVPQGEENHAGGEDHHDVAPGEDHEEIPPHHGYQFDLEDEVKVVVYRFPKELRNDRGEAIPEGDLEAVKPFWDSQEEGFDVDRIVVRARRRPRAQAACAAHQDPPWDRP